MMKPSVISSIVVLEIEMGVACVGFLEITDFFWHVTAVLQVP